MHEDASIDDVLTELEELLSGLNYGVFLKLFRTSCTSGAKPERCVGAVLGECAVIGGIQPVTAAELALVVETSLRYAGDKGHGPEPQALTSQRFEELLAFILRYLSEKCQSFNTIVSFWLKEGHPFYPVFWDFAFLLIGTETAELFIGSSSD